MEVNIFFNSRGIFYLFLFREFLGVEIMRTNLGRLGVIRKIMKRSFLGLEKMENF